MTIAASQNKPRYFAFVFFAAGLIGQIIYLSNLQTQIDFALANITLTAICLYCLLLSKSMGFSLYLTFYVFHYIFFCLIPPLEVSFNVVYWSGSASVLNAYVPAAMLSAALMVVFDRAYWFFFRRRPSRRPLLANRPPQSPVIAVILSLSAMLLIYWYNEFSIVSVMVRGGEFVSRVNIDQTYWLVYQNAIYPLPAIALVYYLNFCKRTRIVTILLACVLLIANPPTGMAKFQAASLYMAVALSAYPRLIERKIYISAALIFGMFFIFPILDGFRRISSDYVFSWSIDFIYAGHFDAFQSLARVMSEQIVTGGRQLMGAVLFFIPRSIWPSKPIGSGAYVANEIGLGFSNVSMTYIGEGYINFGIVGSVLFVFFAGWFSGRLDASFYIAGASNSVSRRVFYLFSLGLFFFMLRGDLLSSFSYSVGLLLAVVGLTTASRFLSPRLAS